jgi:hypothetical protein
MLLSMQMVYITWVYINEPAKVSDVKKNVPKAPLPVPIYKCNRTLSSRLLFGPMINKSSLPSKLKSPMNMTWHDAKRDRHIIGEWKWRAYRYAQQLLVVFRWLTILYHRLFDSFSCQYIILTIASSHGCARVWNDDHITYMWQCYMYTKLWVSSTT